MTTGGRSSLSLREMTTCVVLLWLNDSRLPSLHFSMVVKSLVRRENEMLLWGEISPQARPCELKRKEELRKVSSVKE